ncbi:MAG: hypothetical protein V7691_00875 [Galbibacter orientalis]|uniref:hypothetical protein n=1 Tax=Galbibacter orientalis TaxID=453852 RepID=UPI0030015D5B
MRLFKLLTTLLIIGLYLSCSNENNSKEEHKIWRAEEYSFTSINQMNSFLDGDLNKKQPLVYIYDISGNLIELHKYDYKGRISNSIIYEYDSFGNRIKFNRKDSNIFGKYEHTSGISKIDNNRVIEESFINKNGDIYLTAYYNYFKDSINITGRRFNDNIPYTPDFEIFPDNNNLQLRYGYNYSNQNSINLQISKYVFNKKGLLDSVYYSSGNSFGKRFGTQYKYEYNKKNQWIKKFEIRLNKEPIEYKRRDKTILITDTIKSIKYRKIINYPNEIENDSKFVGAWNDYKSNDWIVFSLDGKFEIGNSDRIEYQGEWKLDSDYPSITIQEEYPKKYAYKFTNKQNLILYNFENGKEISVLTRK